MTTTMDVSMYSQNMFPTAELIEAGEIIGPRGFSTGDNITAGDAARANEMYSPRDALAAVRKMADWGATSINSTRSRVATSASGWPRRHGPWA
ncbi:MAG: hypothetical protein ACT4P7_19130 [Gemmatimonadaceae bacterium]